MSVLYKCKHCHEKIGELEENQVDAEMLGLNKLNPFEQREMIQNLMNGEAVVHAICENCEQTLAEHPHYHEQDYFIH